MFIEGFRGPQGDWPSDNGGYVCRSKVSSEIQCRASLWQLVMVVRFVTVSYSYHAGVVMLVNVQCYIYRLFNSCSIQFHDVRWGLREPSNGRWNGQGVTVWLRGLCTVVHPKLWSCKYCMSVVACGCFLDVSNTVYCMPVVACGCFTIVLHASACGCLLLS